MVHALRALDGIPVQDGIGHEAQTTGCVHALLVIAGRKFPLVGKENPAGHLVAVCALIELALDRPASLPIGQRAQNVWGFDDAPEVGKRLGQPVRWKAGSRTLGLRIMFRDCSQAL